MGDLPKVRQEFEADTRGYSGNLREAAQDADKFSRNNDQAALAARRMGFAAKEAADKAARAQKEAADAAEKLARGELKADEAARAAARAENELERASIKAAEAQLVAGKAADEAAKNFKQMARDAELGAAAENLAMLKATGKVREHNAEVLRLRKEMPELGKDSSEAFKLMSSASNKFGGALDSATSGLEEMSGRGKLILPAVLVGLQLLPAAASVAGGAITLGLGGALSFIGLKAQASNKDVRKSFSDTRAAITDDLHHISEPWHQTLLTMSADAKRSWYGLSPTLEGAFAKMAPAFTRFSSSAADSLSELNPAIDSIGTAFSRTLDKLGGRAPAIMNNLGTSIKAITDAVAANPDALPSFIQDVTELTRYAADGVGVLIRYSSEIKNAFEVANAAAIGPLGDVALGVLKLAHVTRDSGSGFQVVTKTFPTFAQQAIVAAAGAHQLMTAEQAAALSADQLKTAMDNLTGKTLTERESMIQYRSSITAMNQALRENGHAHGFATQKGAANEQALDNEAVAAQKAAQEMRNNGRSTQEVSAYLSTARQRLIAAAEKMGYSSSQARALASSLLGVTHAANTIPSSKRITIYSNASSETARVNAMRSALNALHSKTITITTYYQQVEAAHHAAQAERARARGGLVFADGGLAHLADGGMPRRFYPDGGPVSGPGTSTSDSIPAMLSDGEFVVNAKQTAKWLPLLESINAGVEGFASGGVAKTPKQLLAAMASAKKKEATYEKDEARYKKLYAKYRKEYAAHHSSRYRKAEEHALAEERKYHKLAGEQAALYKKYKAQYDAIGRPSQAPKSPLPAKLQARPEYLAAMAAQNALTAMRSSVYGGYFRGGPSTLGSAHGSVVQHITTVHVHVAGSIRSDRELAQVVQQQLITNRMPVTLPGGRL